MDWILALPSKSSQLKSRQKRSQDKQKEDGRRGEGDEVTGGGQDFYQKTVCGSRLVYHFPFQKRNLSNLQKVWSVTVKG